MLKKKLIISTLFTLSAGYSFGYEIISNFGRTGIFEIPTAYTVPDGNITLGASYVYPYLRGFINVGFFPGLEMGAVITDIRNIKLKGKYWEGYGDYKDKAFFIKYQLLPEMGKFPAIAIGWDDFHGTKLFDTKYLVVSKYIDYGLPQEITVGYATGKMLEGPFVGTEILLHPKYTFAVEYAPINKDELKGLKNEEIKSKVNVGLKYQPTTWMQIVLSYQRGNQYGININLKWPMGKLWLPHIPKHFRLSKEDIKLIKENKQTLFYEKALERLELINPAVYIEGDTLVIEYENRGYFFDSVSIGKALSILKVLYFPNVRKVKIILKDNDVPVSEVIIPGQWVNFYLTQSATLKEVLQHSQIKFSPLREGRGKKFFLKPKWDIFPRFRTFLNDPSGFFKYMLSIDIGLTEKFAKHWRLDAYLFIPLINNISTVNKPSMEEPVRSDIADYLGIKHPNFAVLSLSYIDKISPRTFYGISAGYNELMFAGIGGDIIHFINDGRLAVGMGGDFVYKRDPNKVLGLRNWNYHDEYISFYYRTKNPEMQFTIKAGRFLAGDKGIRFEVSRIVRGFEVGFWYTYSDTSDFTGPNKDYHDKGVFVRIPFRIWKMQDTQYIAEYSLSPWTRDVGQLAGRPFDLYRELVKKLPFYIKDKAGEQE